MTTPLPLGLAPYISPTTLITAPTGIDWSTMGSPPQTRHPRENMAEIWNMCGAGHRPRRFVHEPDHSGRQQTWNCVHGPDYRVTVGPASGRFLAYPVLGGHGAAQRADHLVPVADPPGDRGENLPERRLAAHVDVGARQAISSLKSRRSESTAQWRRAAAADGGQAILVGGGYINRCAGRNGWAIQVTYVNGWPHCSLSAARPRRGDNPPRERLHRVGGRATTTGRSRAPPAGSWTPGSGKPVHVTAATATAGPGTLTLSSPLNYPHQAGTLVTTMPAQCRAACILFCTAEALTRGATSTTIHAVGGAAQGPTRALRT